MNSKGNTMKRHPYFIFLSLGILLLTSCASPSTPAPAAATQTPSPLPTTAILPTGTLEPTPVQINSLPGFQDWSVFNAPLVDISFQDNALSLTLKHRALWFMS